MDKPFKTLDEQIRILQNRGLIVDRIEETKNYLLFHNYYKTVNGYGYFLYERAGSTRFMSGSRFAHIVAIEQCDSRFKSTCFKFILDIEHYFKSVMAYEFSKANVYEVNFYLNKKNYDLNISASAFDFVIEKACKSIINKYSKLNDGNSIAHYSQNHDCIPLWVIIEFFDFGQTLSMFKILPMSIKNEIAKDFSQLVTNNLGLSFRVNVSDLEEYMNVLKELRNLIAHNNRLYDHVFRNNIKYIPEIYDYYGIGARDDRNKVFHVLVLMKLFLTNDQYVLMHNSVYAHFKRLKNKISDVLTDRVLDSLGVVDDYLLKFPKIPQK